MILQRLAAIYLIGVALAVGAYFVVNPLHAESFNPENVWRVLNILMVVGLVIALVFNFQRKRRTDADHDEGMTRRYFEANLTFYGTVGVALLFFHNYFSLLAFGQAGALGIGEPTLNHQAWVIWAVVDTLLPIVFAVTGVNLWRESAEE